jgi:nucleoside-diphosphate-sugar epimerase
MRVVIAGGHGQVALHLTEQLAQRGDEAVGLIRNPDHEADVVERGGTATVFDLERHGADALADVIAGADAVVFAAGAGPGSGAARKLTVDLGGAVQLIDACHRAAVRRYVMVSAIAADRHDPRSEDVYQVYLRAKSEADRALRESGLDWTVVRPGGLTNDDATGRVLIAAETGRAQIPRADVAAVLAECLRQPATIGSQFEVVGGETAIATAVAEFAAELTARRRPA